MAFQPSAYLLDGQMLHIRYKQNQMRISHADKHTLHRRAAHIEEVSVQRSVGSGHLLLVLQQRLAHIDRDSIHPPTTDGQRKLLDARKCFEGDVRLRCPSFFIDILSDAPAGIAAHHGFRAVGIEYPHGEIGHLAMSNQHQAVRTYSRMLPAPKDGTTRRIAYRRQTGIDIDIVISQSMHLRKGDSC